MGIVYLPTLMIKFLYVAKFLRHIPPEVHLELYGLPNC